MLELIKGFPLQCKEAIKIGEEFTPPSSFQDFSKIVVLGMGGSGIPGDILRNYLYYKLDTPILVIKDYNLPKFVDKDTLIFAISYSGDTEETLSAFQEAIEKSNKKIIAITSGGRLKREAEEKGIPFITLPSGFPPRQAIAYLFLPILLTLQKLNKIEGLSRELEEMLNVLESSELEEEGKDLSQKLYRKIPIIYGVEGKTESLALRWKTQFNENSKNLCFINTFPELNHNEIVGWEGQNLKDFVVIILRDKTEHPRIKKRIEITKRLISSPVIEVFGKGEGLLSRLFFLLHLGDFTSFYLARLNQVDPYEIKSIDYLKKELKRCFGELS